MAHHDEYIDESRVYGLMAEFDDPEHLVAAVNKAYEKGYRRMDAYTPFPIHGLQEALRLKNSFVPPLTLFGGIAGAIAGFGLQHFVHVIEYPMNIGGRPNLSWPSFIPITFEVAILTAAMFTIVGMLMLNGLPRPHHPVFNAPGFENASRDKFFLCIEADDDLFDEDETETFLQGCEPQSVSLVRDES
jgi:hypothetical protein